MIRPPRPQVPGVSQSLRAAASSPSLFTEAGVPGSTPQSLIPMEKLFPSTDRYGSEIPFEVYGVPGSMVDQIQLQSLNGRGMQQNESMHAVKPSKHKPSSKTHIVDQYGRKIVSRKKRRVSSTPEKPSKNISLKLDPIPEMPLQEQYAERSMNFKQALPLEKFNSMSAEVAAVVSSMKDQVDMIVQEFSQTYPDAIAGLKGDQLQRGKFDALVAVFYEINGAIDEAIIRSAGRGFLFEKSEAYELMSCKERISVIVDR